MPDWTIWHERYDNPKSPLSQRLAIVQGLIGNWLDGTAPNAVSIVSVCAGDGRDIIQVLAGRADGGRIRATLLELDPALCAQARDTAAAGGLDIEVRQLDAGLSAAYRGAVPADLVLLVGMLGNIGQADIRATIEGLASLCNPGALVIWTLRRDSNAVAQTKAWLAAQDFHETFGSRNNPVFHVGAHRFSGRPRPLAAEHRFFSFTV